MRKILYIFLPCLLALTTPSLSKTRKQFIIRGEKQYQEHNNYQNPPAEKSSESGIIIRSIASGFIISILALCIYFLIDYLDIKYNEGGWKKYCLKTVTVTMTRPNGPTMLVPNPNASTWDYVLVQIALWVPAIVLSTLLSTPILYLIFGTFGPKADEDESEQLSPSINRPRSRY